MCECKLSLAYWVIKYWVANINIHKRNTHIQPSDAGVVNLPWFFHPSIGRGEGRQAQRRRWLAVECIGETLVSLPSKAGLELCAIDRVRCLHTMRRYEQEGKRGRLKRSNIRWKILLRQFDFQGFIRSSSKKLFFSSPCNFGFLSTANCLSGR